MQVRSSVPREDEYTNGLVGTSLGDDRLGGCGRIVSAHVQGFFQYLAVTHTASIVCVLLILLRVCSQLQSTDQAVYGRSAAVDRSGHTTLL